MKRKIRIAVPSKGRLNQPSIQALQAAGINILRKERTYVSETSDPRFETVFARAFDVPIYIQYGAADLGLTGHDVILERKADVHELLDLGFGKCQLVVAVPENSAINSINDVPAVARVATEYPNLCRKYFENVGKQVEILVVRGTAELAPRLGLAQIIVDITETGETLRRNKLKVIATILDSSCRLACNRIAYRVFESEIKELLGKLRSGRMLTK
ncbi:MAG: ATP phosphoribosyltransferase [Candidatus Bathyarchaeota archaeon]|nr:ATP phosphoribosyltransferase [Candidatus Bathyarchaeota archaeon]MDH5712763.1 ATP phosphoribosyltransferase [Candidatus Bathyarchaeota archaeon]